MGSGGPPGAPREDPSSAGFSAPDRARAVSLWPWGGHSSGTRRELPRSWGAVTERDATATTCSCGRGRELRAGPRSGTCPRSAALDPRAPRGPKVRAAGPSPPGAPPPRPGLCPAHSVLPLSSPLSRLVPQGLGTSPVPCLLHGWPWAPRGRLARGPGEWQGETVVAGARPPRGVGFSLSSWG